MMRTDKKLRYFKRKITELCKENIESDMIKAFFKSKEFNDWYEEILDNRDEITLYAVIDSEYKIKLIRDKEETKIYLSGLAEHKVPEPINLNRNII